MAIPVPPMQTLATMIFDGVFDRFPRLKVGVIEQGAVWLPSWMRQLDTAFEAFARGEERLRKLALRPSEYVRRQIRVTPYPTEPVGWIIEQAGPEVCLFSSDWPHVEGGRNPIKRFEDSLAGTPERVAAALLLRQLRRPDGRGAPGRAARRLAADRRGSLEVAHGPETRDEHSCGASTRRCEETRELVHQVERHRQQRNSWGDAPEVAVSARPARVYFSPTSASARAIVASSR